MCPSKSDATVTSVSVTKSSAGDDRAKLLRLLKSYIIAEEEQRTSLLRAIAEVLVEIRSNFERPDGSPDWKGRSYAYRAFLRDVYDDAGVPREDQPAIQAAVRYHVGTVLRERLDQETLDQYDLIPKSPRERAQDRRGERSAMLSALSARESHGGSLLALSAAWTLLSKLNLDDLDTLGPREADVADATLIDVERRVRQLRKRIAAKLREV